MSAHPTPMYLGRLAVDRSQDNEAALEHGRGLGTVHAIEPALLLQA